MIGHKSNLEGFERYRLKQRTKPGADRHMPYLKFHPVVSGKVKESPLPFQKDTTQCCSS
jgi:hypothetical protein